MMNNNFNSINNNNINNIRNNSNRNDNCTNNIYVMNDRSINVITASNNEHPTNSSNNYCPDQKSLNIDPHTLNNNITNNNNNNTINNQDPVNRLIFNQSQEIFTHLNNHIPQQLNPQQASSTAFNQMYLISDNNINNQHIINNSNGIDAEIHDSVELGPNRIVPQIIYAQNHSNFPINISTSNNGFNLNTNQISNSFRDDNSTRNNLQITNTSSKIMSILPKLPKQITNDDNIKLKLNSETMNFLFDSEQINPRTNRRTRTRRRKSTGNFTNHNSDVIDSDNNNNYYNYDENNNSINSYFLRRLPQSSLHTKQDKLGNVINENSENRSINNDEDSPKPNKPVVNVQSSDKRHKSNSFDNISPTINNDGHIDNNPTINIGDRNGLIDNNDEVDENSKPIRKKRKYTRRKPTLSEIEEANVQRYLNSMGYRPMVMVGSNEPNQFTSDNTAIETKNTNSTSGNNIFASNVKNKNDDDNEDGTPNIDKDKADLNDRRKFFCKICDKGFTTSGHLARHHRIHTGEKNHPCSFPGCFQRFSRQDNCLQHYRTHFKSRN